MRRTTLLVVLVAIVLLSAIYLREDVKFSVKFWGMGMSLEATDQHAGRAKALNPERTLGDANSRRDN